MVSHNSVRQSGRTTLILALFVFAFVLFIIIFPASSFQASLSGLKIWWDIVFPALLPFFILSEMLIGLGFVEAFGVVLEPAMRLLFGLPGISGWAVAVSFAAGLPAGAEVVSSLRKRQLITSKEGEHLLALSHLVNPVVIVLFVGVGVLHSEADGFIIALVYYVSALISGVIMRPKSAKEPSKKPPADSAPDQTAPGVPRLPARFLQTLKRAQETDGRSFGKLLGDSVNHAVQTLLMIGGTIIFFSVVVNVLTLSGVNALFTLLTGPLWTLIHVPKAAAAGVFAGVFEMHLGAYKLSSLTVTDFAPATSLITAVLAWSGAAAHAQIKSIVQQSGLRYTYFLRFRLLHSLLAFTISVLAADTLKHTLFTAASAQTALLPFQSSSAALGGSGSSLGMWLFFPQMLAALCLVFIALYIVIYITAVFRKWI